MRFNSASSLFFIASTIAVGRNRNRNNATRRHDARRPHRSKWVKSIRVMDTDFPALADGWHSAAEN